MKKCTKCGVHHSGAHLCPNDTIKCNDCGRSYPESEINGHICKLTTAKKHDQEKPDLSLLPSAFLEEVAKAFMHGETKYGRHNYLQGLDWHRVTAAALRHLTAFNDGQDKDSESGLLHLGHAGACIAMLLVYYKKGLGKDTRRKV